MTIDTYDLTNPDKPTIKKDVQAVLDYPFDWTLWLDDIVDSIANKDVTVATGITLDSSAIVGKTVVVWLSGGAIGEKYKIDCKIITAGGRTDSRSIYVKVVDR